jgi:peptide/nickel transport system substrate-binding protein
VAGQAYDPAAAAKLLTDAGWAKNADGVYEKDGQKLTIVLKTHSEDPNRIQILEFLQNVFKENGVDASVETTEWPTYIAAVQQHDYQIALIGWLRLIDPDYAMYAQFRCDGGLNWGGYCDPKLDDLLAQGRANADQTQRAELYQQVATTVVDQVYYDVLLYQGYIVATRDNVTGFVPNPSGSWKSLTVTSLS